ncbi:MAG: Fe-S protein assembly chaperone HscA [Cellvibrionaceae bacterium]|nr:Fe-S protein assembly chaperone HscA [Cellvibrionaceae bacterium]
MALFQISEPGQSPSPHAKKRAIGIDLGTTHSLAAKVSDAKPEVLMQASGKALLPSVVRYTPSQTLVGDAAKAAAVDDPLNTLVSIKRLLGRSVDELRATTHNFPYRFVDNGSSVPHIETAAGVKTPIDISADILSELASVGRQALGGALDGVVITVPAYFDNAQRQATKDAARLAGLTVLRLLNEPTAAAVAYGLDQGDEGYIAIYDLGGGTFDISILHFSQGVFEVLATGGDAALGGDDFDCAIKTFLCEQLQITQELTPREQRQLLSLACRLKEALSVSTEASADYQGRVVTLTREQMQQLIDPLIAKTLRACKRSLRDAGLSIAEIDHIVMVGGSTRSLRVRQQVADFFGQPPLVDIDPDQVVALGAALQADILVGNKPDNEMLLLDVVPLSLGLETMGGLVEKIIPRNTTIPVAKAQEFTTFKDGQQAMSFHITQGERERVADCRSLASFELRGIPPMVAGAAHVKVTFQIDADGLLSVSAQEQTTKTSAEIRVKPAYGLDDKAIATMLRESAHFAQEDMQARSLTERQLAAEQLIETLAAALIADGEALLSADEYRNLQQALDALRAVYRDNDVEAIDRQIEQVNKVSDVFAARRMDANIKKALSGHHLHEFESNQS